MQSVVVRFPQVGEICCVFPSATDSPVKQVMGRKFRDPFFSFLSRCPTPLAGATPGFWVWWGPIIIYNECGVYKVIMSGVNNINQSVGNNVVNCKPHGDCEININGNLADDSRKIFVRGLSWETNEEDLRK